jgi:hypothetical protein
MPSPDLAACRICRHADAEVLSERGLCPTCEARAEIVRRNLAGAAKSKLKPPEQRPECSLCKYPMAPVLFRPEGPWTFYCVKGCRGCPQCWKVHRFDELCPFEDARRA